MNDKLSSSPSSAAAQSAESELLAKARDGDKMALREIIERHQAEVYRLILRQLADKERALELTQDTFIRMCRSLNTFRGETSLRFWILKIACNLCRTHFNSGTFRRQTLTVPLGDDELADPSSDPREPLQKERDIRRALLLLPRLTQEHREVIALCILERKSYEDAARLLNIPIGTVGSRLNHGMHRLRRLFFSDDDQ